MQWSGRVRERMYKKRGKRRRCSVTIANQQDLRMKHLARTAERLRRYWDNIRQEVGVRENQYRRHGTPLQHLSINNGITRVPRIPSFLLVHSLLFMQTNPGRNKKIFRTSQCLNNHPGELR